MVVENGPPFQQRGRGFGRALGRRADIWSTTRASGPQRPAWPVWQPQAEQRRPPQGGRRLCHKGAAGGGPAARGGCDASRLGDLNPCPCDDAHILAQDQTDASVD